MTTEEEVPRNSTDPSLDPSHLTPEGKRKSRHVDKEAQKARFDQMVEDRANEVIPKEITLVPGDNLKPKPRKIIGIDD